MAQSFGSLVNHLSAQAAPEVPVVGMPATILLWSDRTPATVVAVSPNGKLCTVRECIATRTDTLGMSDVQSYAYAEDENGRTTDFVLTKRGGWREVGTNGKGNALRLGRREKYHDYSF